MLVGPLEKSWSHPTVSAVQVDALEVFEPEVAEEEAPVEDEAPANGKGRRESTVVSTLFCIPPFQLTHMLVAACLTESFVNANQVHLFVTHTIPQDYGLFGKRASSCKGSCDVHQLSACYAVHSCCCC